MFGFLKDKLKKAVSKFSKVVEEEAENIEQDIENESDEQEIEDKKAKPAKLSNLKESSTRAAELSGLKESLESYSEEELDSLLTILELSTDTKQKSVEKKISSILLKPLAEITAAMEKLATLEDVPAFEELPEKAVEESREETEPTAEDEEPKKEKKGGFFKKIFGFGKKKEDKREAEEEPEKELEEERKEETNFFEEAELPERAKERDKELEELDHKKDIIEETLKEEDSRLKKFEKEKAELEKEKYEEIKKEKERKKSEEEKEEEYPEAPEEYAEKEEEYPEEPEEKKGFFGRLTRLKEELQLKRLSDAKFEDIFFELELALLENNTAVEVIEKIKNDLREKMVDKKIRRSDIEKTVISSLKKSLDQILDAEQIDLLAEIAKKRKSGEPFVIVFVGINGSGKTTTIAKMAKYFMNNKIKPIMVAADTFRAAAIQQLEEHANNLNIKLIKHDYGSDPAAVAFDGIKHAKAKGYDVVLIDTAGRLHSNTNLMDEMKKIIRVSKPDMKLFIGESITGNDCIEQAQKFDETVKLDGIILSKADVDEKGGAAISVSYVTGKPILFLGTGQTYDSLERFDKALILRNLGLD